jgi:hypothetical protein
MSAIVCYLMRVGRAQGASTTRDYTEKGTFVAEVIGFTDNLLLTRYAIQ